MTADSNECTPNIAPAGIRRRRRLGFQLAGVSIAAVGAGMIFRAPWIARTAVFLPAAVAAIGFLQASRNTLLAGIAYHQAMIEVMDPLRAGRARTA